MIAAMFAARRAGARLMSTGKLSVGSVKWFNLTKGFGARAREKTRANALRGAFRRPR